MIPDSAMRDDLLKKTGSGNLFIIFGEPDIEIRTTDNDYVLLEIHGPDIYGPTTSAVRPSSVDDIAASAAGLAITPPLAPRVSEYKHQRRVVGHQPQEPRWDDQQPKREHRARHPKPTPFDDLQCFVPEPGNCEVVGVRGIEHERRSTSLKRGIRRMRLNLEVPCFLRRELGRVGGGCSLVPVQ
jgi:hypothetical protein